MSQAPAMLSHPATFEELQAAFAAFAWRGVTLEQALADRLRRGLLEGRVAAMRGRLKRATHPRERLLVRRVNPTTGQYVTTTHAGAHTEPPDLLSGLEP